MALVECYSHPLYIEQIIMAAYSIEAQHIRHTRTPATFYAYPQGLISTHLFFGPDPFDRLDRALREADGQGGWG